MKRSHMILTGLLVVQLALILLVRSPFASTGGSVAAHPLFPDLEELAVARLQFEGDEDSSTTLAREGDAWVVREIGNYPADAGKVEKLIETLSGLSVRRPVVQSSRYHKAFKLVESDNEGRVRIWAEGQDSPAVDLILGNSPNYRSLNVRRAGDDEVYEVQGLATYDVSAQSSYWIDKQMVDVADSDLVAVSVTNSLGTIGLERRGGVWFATAPASLIGKALDPQKVDALVRQARAMRIDGAAGPIDDAAQGLAEPSATVVLRYSVGGPPEPAVAGEAQAAPAPVEELTVRIGAKASDNESQRYVARSGFGFAGTVWESSVQKLVEQNPDELLPGDTAGS